ncbi:MAG: cytochrome c peroxidase [Chitinophagaceae bacterium]
MKNYIVLLSFIALSIVSCHKFSSSPISSSSLSGEIPSYFPFNTDRDNAEIHLGRVLFYEKALSKNNSISCASCHKQSQAFADNVAFSAGFENRLTKRNSIAIQNLNPSSITNFFGESSLFWDGRENDLNSLITKPIANHIEMGIDDEVELMKKVNQLPYVKELALKAYERESLSVQDLSMSMARFLSIITTQNSAFDLSQSNVNPGQYLTPLQKQGQFLFNNTYQCNNCHHPSPGSYMSSGFVNIGLDVNPQDPGREGITNNAEDFGKFKVPDLHNVSLTAPYMHDGRFATLDDVLEHYSHGIKSNEFLDFRLKNENGSPKQFNISAQDKKAIIAFLESMTDYTLLSNSMLSNPFHN